MEELFASDIEQDDRLRVSAQYVLSVSSQNSSGADILPNICGLSAQPDSLPFLTRMRFMAGMSSYHSQSSPFWKLTLIAPMLLSIALLCRKKLRCRTP